MESIKSTQLDYIKDELTEFEKTEILDYRYIYYVGDINVKFNKHINYNIYLNNCNIFGNNDRFVIRINDHIRYRYKILDSLGKGAYGDVIKVKDYKYNKIRAIKLFNNPNYYTKEQNDKLFLKELEILEILYKRFNKKKNEELFTLFYNEHEFRNFNFITFKLYDGNLHKERRKIYESSINNKLVIIKDILNALIFLTGDSPKIIHGDVKPENILFKSKDSFHIVLGDFGLSTILKNESKSYKKLIQTRWYRSPEIIYKLPFNEKIDIWSFGCILYEIIANRPLFKSYSDKDQIVYIHYIIGIPTREFINSHENIKLFYNYKYKPINMRNEKDSLLIPGYGCYLLDRYFEFSELSELCDDEDHPEIKNEGPINYNLTKLIYKCLDYDEKTRISAEKALDIVKQL